MPEMMIDSMRARSAPVGALSPAALIRSSGSLLALAGLLFALFPLLHPNHDEAGFRSALWLPAHLSLHVGAILTLFGLIGLFVRQLRPAGSLGLVAFATAFVGTALILTLALIEIFIIPFMALELPQLFAEDRPPPGVGEASMLVITLFTIGHVLLGAAVIRAGIFPRAAGILLIAGVLFFTQGGTILGLLGLDGEAAFPVSTLPFGAALAWLGYLLRTDTLPDAGDTHDRAQ